MSARGLHAELKVAGFRLEATAGAIRIEPASALTQELRERIRAQKPELLKVLEQEAEIRRFLAKFYGPHPDAAEAVEIALRMPDAALESFRADVLEGRPWTR